MTLFPALHLHHILVPPFVGLYCSYLFKCLSPSLHCKSLMAVAVPSLHHERLAMIRSIIQNSLVNTTAFPVVQMVPRVLLTLIQIPALVLGYRKDFFFFYVHFCVVFWSTNMHPIFIIVWLFNML